MLRAKNNGKYIPPLMLKFAPFFFAEGYFADAMTCHVCPDTYLQWCFMIAQMEQVYLSPVLDDALNHELMLTSSPGV